MISKEENKSRLMTETTFYILLTLVEPLHGYAVMKKVEEIKEDDHRKFYQLTGKGKKILSDQIVKLSIMVKMGGKYLRKFNKISKEQEKKMENKKIRKIKWFWSWQDNKREE